MKQDTTRSRIRAGLVQIYVGLMIRRRRRLLQRKAGTKFGNGVQVDLFTELEGGNRLGERVNIQSSRVGFGTYIADGSTLRHTRIGRYCSIGGGVRCGLGTHPASGYVSTHPAFFSTLGQAGFTYVECQKFDELPKAAGEDWVVSIGNDVWIGAGAVIMDGIKISDGAIIGANATVTRDVPAYSVCVGSPARVIKYRFKEDLRDWLSALAWWDLGEDWIKEHASEFASAQGLREQVRRESEQRDRRYDLRGET